MAPGAIVGVGVGVDIYRLNLGASEARCFLYVVDLGFRRVFSIVLATISISTFLFVTQFRDKLSFPVE